MPPRRPRPDNDDENNTHSPARPPKRPRLSTPSTPLRHTGPDLLSALSDELLIRILTHLTLPHLLQTAPVSRRFHRLAEDSQLWKALYYARFVLPRAMRIPGFRAAATAAEDDSRRVLRQTKVHYKGRRVLWADGRLGGLVREEEARRLGDGGRDHRVLWKRQYKIRHNWARGKCAVEELRLGPEVNAERRGEDDGVEDGSDGMPRGGARMLVKVVEGLAVTVDQTGGLRAWDLKTRGVLAQTKLDEEDEQAAGNEDEALPSCLAVDDRELDKGTLDIAVGFVDGSFGVWRLAISERRLTKRYRHERSSNGELVAMAYLHPYVLTATGAVLISLYTFDRPEGSGDQSGKDEEEEECGEALPKAAAARSLPQQDSSEAEHEGSLLPAPYLLSSLTSHTSYPPLALSIRKAGSTTIASIAYTFTTSRGWSLGIQDLHITTPSPSSSSKRPPPDITTRLAYTDPHPATRNHHPQPSAPRNPTTGPVALCYTHPYLLATLPDNTLVLHMCTSTAAALAISPGLRLWGHTSGISDAEITARGKAVSVSSRGEEMRVWELEGYDRVASVRRQRLQSVEVRADKARVGSHGSRSAEEQKCVAEGIEEEGGDEEGRWGEKSSAQAVVDWEARRNWVGFDDEMVIVLKEARGGRESLLVYDFT